MFLIGKRELHEHKSTVNFFNTAWTDFEKIISSMGVVAYLNDTAECRSYVTL